MKLALVLVMAFTASVASAQQAKVLVLSAADSDEAHAKWDVLQKAQADWDAEVKKIETSYVYVHRNDPEAGNLMVPIFSFSSTAIWSGDLGGNPCRKETEAEDELRKKQEAAQQKYFDEAWYMRQGWENGFEFSKDFRFIVPKPESQHSPQWALPWYGSAAGTGTINN